MMKSRNTVTEQTTSVLTTIFHVNLTEPVPSPRRLASFACSRTEPLRKSGMAFYGLDVLPVTQPMVSNENKALTPTKA